MQAVRCLKFFHQCSPKASDLLRCFWSKQNVAQQSPKRTRFVQLYNCTRMIVTQQDDTGGETESENPKDGKALTNGTPSEEEQPQDTNMQYFSSLVSSPSKRTSVIEQKLRAKASNLKDLKPALPANSGNLAAYVNDSETLTKLTQLGVDLSIVERNAEASNHILRADFETGIKPYLEFLLDLGVTKDDLKLVITKNPSFLMEETENLQYRINYLQSKKFSDEAIARIVTKSPLFLTHQLKTVDTNLGVIQKLFGLNGDEVRHVVTAYPKLATWSVKRVQESHFVMKEFLGFTEIEQRGMLLIQPKIYTTNNTTLEAIFDYLHNTMGLSHADICVWPQVFRTRLFIIKQRHEFLKSIDRAQYNPRKENFVSLKALVSGRDSEFCDKVAKVPVSQFNNYLKSV